MRPAFVVLLALLGALVVPVEPGTAQTPSPPRPREATTQASALTQDLVADVRALAGSLPRNVSRTGYELRHRLELLTQSLIYLGYELTGVTYDALDGKQRAYFADAEASVASWKDRSRLTVADVSRVLDATYDVYETIPGASRAPTISRISPAYLPMRPTSTEPVVITFSGSRLSTGAPALQFGNRRCTLRRQSFSEIEFTCPARMFLGPHVPSARFGQLTVYHRRTLSQALRQETPRWHRYLVGVYSIPPIMGTYRVSAIKTMQRIEEAQRQTAPFFHENDFCESPREVVWSVESTPGWIIDVNTILVEDMAKTGESQSRRAFDRTGAGFRFGGVVGNSGSCETAADGTRTQDVRGSLRARATYREYRPITSDILLDIKDGQIHWGGDITVALPDDIKGVEVEVRQIDGQRFVETALPSTHPWYTVSMDPARREVVIRPKTVTDALD